MDSFDLVLAVVANEPRGGVLGRTLLQKKVFFLNEMIQGPVRFFPHYYGPYSRQVAETIDSLVTAGIIVERAESCLHFQTPWGESTRYSYALADDKKKEKILSILKARIGEEKYSMVSRELARINERPEARNYKQLSIAAKVSQILKEKRSVLLSDFPKEAGKLNWKLSQGDVKKAAEFLKVIGLLSEAT